MKSTFAISAFLLIALSAFAPNANASVMSYGFTHITTNSGAVSASSVASQLQVDVWDAAATNTVAFTNFYSGLGLFSPVAPVNVGPAKVLFVFRNNVGLASSISEIYFADGTLLSQHGIHNSLSGYTAYTAGASPGNLPNGSSVGFYATTAFSADAVGNPSKGINASNDLAGLSYTLQSGQTYSDTIASLADGRLRIGLHLRAIGQFSESFVNGGNGRVPEPASLAVWGLGILGLTVGEWNRRRKIID